VFDQEAPPADHPSLAGNVILSLHSDGLSDEAAIRMAIPTARNALAGKLDPSTARCIKARVSVEKLV
jgi:hypothetical protein